MWRWAAQLPVGTLHLAHAAWTDNLDSSVLLTQPTKSYSARLQTYCYAVLDVAAKIGFGAVIIGSNNRLMESYGIGRWVPLLDFVLELACKG